MKDIRIIHHGRNSFEIIQGDKTSEELGYDEALGLLSSLMMPENRPCLHWMQTKEEHNACRDILKNSPKEMDKGLYKTFEDLEFNSHWTGHGYQSHIDFKNGYGVSVVFGNSWYSNGIDTYEVAVLKDGVLCYSTPITDDVIGYQTKDQVTEIMKRIQKL